MAFWGVEIKPGHPFLHELDPRRGRLHISQATLGIGKSDKKSLLQCNVGDKSPVLLCSLIPDKTESCPLDIEFEEDEEVILSVIGPRSVHLTGFYLGNGGHDCRGDDSSDSYGEEIGETESEDGSSDYDSLEDDEDESEDDFTDDDMDMFSQPKRKSGVVIEEILDDEKAANGNDNPKWTKMKNQMSGSDDVNQQQIVVSGSAGNLESDSEDEDGLPKSPLSKNSGAGKTAEVEDKSVEKVMNGKKEAAADDQEATGSKRKMKNVEAERGVEMQDSAMPSSEVQPENEKPKKKKRKQSKKEKALRVGDNNKSDVHPEDITQVQEAKTENMVQDQPVRKAAVEEVPDKSVDGNNVSGEDQADVKKKKRKNKKNKKGSDEKSANLEEQKKGFDIENGSLVETGEKKQKKKPRTYSNGLVVEDLKMGKPDGKRASKGNRVFVHYVGKLKSNGKIFDSCIGKAPFKFRLGIGEVIKGWDVGVDGMRIGDKRRITVPPSMGYGSKGAPPHIPQNAWLVFDVDLVDVR